MSDKPKTLAEFVDGSRAMARKVLANCCLDEMLDLRILPIMRKKPKNMILIRGEESVEVETVPVQQLIVLAWGLQAEKHDEVHRTLNGAERSEPCPADGTCWSEFRDLWGPCESVVASDLGDALFMLTRDRNDAPCASGFFTRMRGDTMMGRVSVPCSMVHMRPEDLQDYGFSDIHPKDRRLLAKSFGDPSAGGEFLNSILTEAAKVAGEILGVPRVLRHAIAHVIVGHGDGPILTFVWFHRVIADGVVAGVRSYE